MTEIFEFLVLFLTFFASSSTNTAHRIRKNQKLVFPPSPSLSFPLFDPSSYNATFVCPQRGFESKTATEKTRQSPTSN